MIKNDQMLFRFSLYGFLKNLRFFDPFIVLIFLESGLTFFQIGLLYAIRDLATNIFEIPTGIFADAFGRRKSMIMAFLAYIASFFIFYLLSDFYAFAGAMLLFGLGEAFRSGTHKALILEYLNIQNMGDMKVAYYGRTRSASQFGSAINALIAAVLVFYTGSYRIMFLAAVVPYVLDLFNLMTYPSELDGTLMKVTKETLFERLRVTLQDFTTMFSDGAALRSVANSASFGALFKTTKDYLQPILESFALSLPFFLWLTDKKRSAVVIGIIYFVIYLFTSYASRKAAGFSQRFSSLGRAINITFLLGVGLLFIAGFVTWLQLIIFSIIIFLGFYILHNLRRPMNVAFISDQISHHVMASGLSVESQLTTLLTVVFAPILGGLADHLGIGAALAILGFCVLLLFSFVRVQEKPSDSL
ncbi:MAG: MFS transporter [Chloroflexota bacterium]